MTVSVYAEEAARQCLLRLIKSLDGPERDLALEVGVHMKWHVLGSAKEFLENDPRDTQ